MQGNSSEILWFVSIFVICLFLCVVVLGYGIKIFRSRAKIWVKVLVSTVAAAVSVLLSLVLVFLSFLIVDDFGLKPENERLAYHVAPDGAQAIVVSHYFGFVEGHDIFFAYRAASATNWIDYPCVFEGNKWKNVEIMQMNSNTLEIAFCDDKRRVAVFDTTTHRLLVDGQTVGLHNMSPRRNFDYDRLIKTGSF